MQTRVPIRMPSTRRYELLQLLLPTLYKVKSKDRVFSEYYCFHLYNSLILPHGLHMPNTGPTNSHATLRLFGQPEASVRTVLYRDHHAWCPYCQKIWLWLEEMRVPYVIERMLLYFTSPHVAG